MNTLLKSYEGNDWFPKNIDTYRNNIKLDMNIEDAKVTRSNIAYNIQYLEFIEKELNELKLHIVLQKMLYKTYIIIGMGIIESLFVNLLKSKGLWKISEWRSIAVLKSNEKRIEDKTLRANTELFEKVDKFDERMDFDSMIKKIESKKILNIDHSVYPTLKILKELRNKIHLQNRNSFSESDYNSFNLEDKKKWGRVLYTILKLDEFSIEDKTEIYDFLICSF